MAVAFDANATAVVTGTGVTGVTNSNLTVGAGANRALVTQLILSLKTASAVTVNWDNAGTPQSQALIVSASGTGTIARAELWGLVAPTSGNKAARAAWTGASDAYLNPTSFTGVDQTGGATSFPHSTSATGTITGVVAFANAITSAVGNFTVGATSLDIGSLSAPTQTQTFLSNALAVDGAASRATGAASVSHGWSGDTNPSHWVFVGTDILAAVAGTPIALDEYGIQYVSIVRNSNVGTSFAPRFADEESEANKINVLVWLRADRGRASVLRELRSTSWMGPG